MISGTFLFRFTVKVDCVVHVGLIDPTCTHRSLLGGLTVVMKLSILTQFCSLDGADPPLSGGVKLSLNPCPG